MTKSNLILDLTLKFSFGILNYGELLNGEQKYVLAKQIVKSGTSIGANANEAQNCESKKDFVHKMKIASKEAGECHYWLTLCRLSEHYPEPGHLLKDLLSIQKVLSKIISTSKGDIK